MSFDAETAVPATGGAVITTAFGTRFAAITSTIFGALSSGAGTAASGVGPKVDLGICQTGTADLEGELIAGTTATLTLTNCVGSPLSSTAVNGRILVNITEVGSFNSGTAEFAGPEGGGDFTIAPDTVLTGSFAVSANFSPSAPVVNLFLGAQENTDLITLSEGGRQLQLGCFDIFTRIGLTSAAIEFFQPLGVVSLDNQVYTLNSYTEGVPNIGFEFSDTGTVVPNSGSLTLFSGDNRVREGSPEPCAPFAGAPAGDTSRSTATFIGGGDVRIDAIGVSECFQCVESWENLLNTLSETVSPSCPAVSCGGNGGTGGGGSPSDCSDVTPGSGEFGAPCRNDGDCLDGMPCCTSTAVSAACGVDVGLCECI
ncbi:MAG: hypothetical protein OER77_06935 [Myxococcales bacterium]|nr:hypothetical protein [Myxococcales bacterium]